MDNRVSAMDTVRYCLLITGGRKLLMLRRGSYGVDAPSALFWIGFSVLCGVGWTIGFAFAFGIAVAVIPLVLTILMLAQFLLYLNSTRRGKFAVWEGLLDELAIMGDERLLDLGCGRGAVLLAAAARLPDGKAVGVDLWRTVDQSGNAEQVTRANAEAEGVAERIELHTGDMTELPFGDGEFDVIVSSLAIHNIRRLDGRLTAIEQALRVLRPGGRLAIVDISSTKDYARRLTELGAQEVRLRGAGWRMQFGILPSRMVTAVKPG